jgi:hypothetical protein
MIIKEEIKIIMGLETLVIHETMEDEDFFSIEADSEVLEELRKRLSEKKVKR